MGNKTVIGILSAALALTGCNKKETSTLESKAQEPVSSSFVSSSFGKMADDADYSIETAIRFNARGKFNIKDYTSQDKDEIVYFLQGGMKIRGVREETKQEIQKNGIDKWKVYYGDLDKNGVEEKITTVYFGRMKF